MAKTRGINTKFWSDVWVRDSLNPLDRYLFLYFLTNEHTNISGIYELPLGTLAFESGIDKTDLERSMLKRLNPKVFYHKGWVIIPNFPKHQNLKSEDVLKGIKREYELAPEDIQKEAIRRGWGDGLGIAQGTILNLTKPTVGAKAPILEVKEDKEDSKPQRRVKDKEAVYSRFSPKREPWWNFKQEKEAALQLFDRGLEKLDAGLTMLRENEDDKYCPKVRTPFEYLEKLPKINAYKKKHGY
jgi:hypothetical protein